MFRGHGDSVKSLLHDTFYFVSRSLGFVPALSPAVLSVGFVYMLVSVCVCSGERREVGYRVEACSGWRGCQLINLHSFP